MPKLLQVEPKNAHTSEPHENRNSTLTLPNKLFTVSTKQFTFFFASSKFLFSSIYSWGIKHVTFNYTNFLFLL